MLRKYLFDLLSPMSTSEKYYLQGKIMWMLRALLPFITPEYFQGVKPYSKILYWRNTKRKKNVVVTSSSLKQRWKKKIIILRNNFFIAKNAILIPIKLFPRFHQLPLPLRHTLWGAPLSPTIYRVKLQPYKNKAFTRGKKIGEKSSSPSKDLD